MINSSSSKAAKLQSAVGGRGHPISSEAWPAAAAGGGPGDLARIDPSGVQCDRDGSLDLPLQGPSC